MTKRTHRTTSHTTTPLADLYVPHSGLCDAGRVLTIGTGSRARLVEVGCTCGAGLVRLMRGES